MTFSLPELFVRTFFNNLHRMKKQRGREERIVRAGLIGIGANVLLSAAKAAIGLLSNSIAVILDAVNNLSDAMSSVLTIVGIKLASKPADREHPFGHGRIEYLSTISVACLIIAAGGASLIESVKKLLHPEVSEHDWTGIIVIALAIFAKLALSRFYGAEGRASNSETLTASGKDSAFDAVIGTATLVAALAGMFFGEAAAWVDGALGLGISAVIIRAGIQMVMSPLSGLLGKRVDREDIRLIKEAVASHEGVLGVYDLILHDYGPERKVGAVNIGVEDRASAHEIYDLTRKIQLDIRKRFGVLLTIGIYASNYSDETTRKMCEKITEALSGTPGVIQVHGLYIDTKDKTIAFDTVADFSVRDIPAFRKTLASKIEALYPEYRVDNFVDVDYTTS